MYAQQQLGYDATLAGLVLAPGAVVLVMLIPVAGKILDHVPGKYVIAFGGLALGAALLYSMNLVPELDFKHLAMMRAAQTAGLAFLFVPISTLAYATVPREKNGDAAALFSMARNVFGGIGISISTALITDHEQIRQSDLAEHLTPGYQPYNVLLQQVQHALQNSGQSLGQAIHNAPGNISGMLLTQTAVLAYNDVFLLTACAAFVLIPTALFMSNVKAKAAGGTH
jgi:DHA2 family multidrug resistance protein